MITSESFKKFGRFDQNLMAINKIIQNEIVPYQSFPKIYILGPTGSGKSSLLCCLTNKNCEIILAKNKIPLLKGDGIGFGGKSCTQMPNIDVDLNNELIFCDCPGFQDTEGLEQEIINSFVIDYLLSNKSGNNQIKILLVVSIYDLNSTRQQVFLDILDQLTEMFPHIRKIRKGIGLIITQENDEYNGIDLLELIEEKASFEMKNWIDYFKRNENQIFTFPKAKKSDVNKKYDFDDHDKLLYFLLNKSNFINNPEHKISLSSQAFDKLEILIENQINKINQIISSFFEQLSQEYNDLTDPNSIKSWIDQIENLYKSNIKNSTDFIKSIEKYLVHYESYENYYSMLNEAEAFNSFLDKIKDQNVIRSVFENCFKKSFEKEINQLKKNYTHAQENLNQKIENQKCHVKIEQLEKNADESKKKQKNLQDQVTNQNSVITTLKQKIDESLKFQQQQKEIINELKEKNREHEEKIKFQEILNEKDKKLNEIKEKNNKLEKEKDEFIQHKRNLRNSIIDEIKRTPWELLTYNELYGKDTNKWPISRYGLKLDSNCPVPHQKWRETSYKYIRVTSFNPGPPVH